MKKYLIFFSGLVVQILTSWFLMENIIFADSYPNFSEYLFYYTLVLLPYGLIVWSDAHKKLKSWTFGAAGYFISAVLLFFAPVINDFFVTGMGGVGFIAASAMFVHFLIGMAAVYANKAKSVRVSIILAWFACIVFTAFFIGFFRTFGWLTEPSSYLALGYLDLKDLVTAAGFTIFSGAFTVFLNLGYLLGFIAYSGLIFIVSKKIKTIDLKKWPHVLAVFIPIWLALFVYGILNIQTVQTALAQNFENFRPTWEQENLINSQIVEWDGVPFNVWCDTDLVLRDDQVVCEDRYLIVSTDQIRATNEDIYPAYMNVGPFERLPVQSKDDEACVFTDGDIVLNGQNLTVQTEWCDARNFPVIARIEWKEFVLPLIECLGSDVCDTRW